MSRPVAVLAVLVVSRRRCAAPQVRVGPEFQVNTYTTSDQDLAVTWPWTRTATSSSSWQSADQDGSGSGVFARWLRRRSGAPLGPTEFRVNTFTPTHQAGPRVAASRPDGEFVVVWTSVRPGRRPDGVFARRFDAAGDAPGPEFAVNTYTTGFQVRPAVAIDACGNFVVVVARRPASAATRCSARRYDARGPSRRAASSA